MRRALYRRVCTEEELAAAAARYRVSSVLPEILERAKRDRAASAGDEPPPTGSLRPGLMRRFRLSGHYFG